MICKDCGEETGDNREHPEERIPCPQCGSKRRVIHASGSVILPAFRMMPPSVTPSNFLAAAKTILRAMHVLVADGSLSLAANLLGAHCLEISLKAFLSSHQFPEKGLRTEIGHDLQKAWTLSVDRGLPLDKTPPHWCELLAACHSHPYRLRYPSSNAVLVLPSQETLLQEMEKVISLVECVFRSNPISDFGFIRPPISVYSDQ